MDLSGAYPDVLVLVGTQTGNSETVADAVAAQLGDVGFSAHVTDMAEAYPEMLDDYRQLVVVLCTWAEGTFPDNTVAFYEALESLGPDLAHLAYGLVGLGDRDYDPYYQTAAYRLADTLDRLGARRALPIHEIDGEPTPRDTAGAVAWALGLAEAFAALHEAP
ncbi:MAG: flavodoxin family protein [Rubricoccaceae bacterium]|nr:flavodoxin family protein [Rubricoccaceae bacterium]